MAAAAASVDVTAWKPAVPGVAEVFHARMVGYAYPPHCHDTWTLLLVDRGTVHYQLDRRPRHAESGVLNILPPGVVHDGRPAHTGFRKRVLYVEDSLLPEGLAGRAVDGGALDDGQLSAAIATVHRRLCDRDLLAAETALALCCERITARLLARDQPHAAPESGAARALRELLDAQPFESITLADAARRLDRNPTHLARSFTTAFGISPHAYQTALRINAARRLLLDGMPASQVAVTVGFADQAHLTRHFRRYTSVTPAGLARAR